MRKSHIKMGSLRGAQPLFHNYFLLSLEGEEDTGGEGDRKE
jgi:hypothetical protein